MRIPETPKEVEESPPHRDETFARALPPGPRAHRALLVVDVQRAFVEAGQAMEVVVPRVLSAKELGDMLRSTS